MSQKYQSLNPPSIVINLLIKLNPHDINHQSKKKIKNRKNKI